MRDWAMVIGGCRAPGSGV